MAQSKFREKFKDKNMYDLVLQQKRYSVILDLYIFYNPNTVSIPLSYLGISINSDIKKNMSLCNYDIVLKDKVYYIRFDKAMISKDYTDLEFLNKDEICIKKCMIEFNKLYGMSDSEKIIIKDRLHNLFKTAIYDFEGSMSANES